MGKQKLLLTTHLSVGDIVTMTAAVRDLHRAHGSKYSVNVATSAMEVWENNPYLDRSINKENADRVIPMHYTDAINKCNQDRGSHFITGYVGHLAKELGVEIPLTEFKPDLHFSRKELETPVLPDLEGRRPYWVMFAGGKLDYTAKWWHQKKFAEVVQLLPDISFVQVGSSGTDKWNPIIPGAIQMTGNTTFRNLMRLILGAHGVLCPVTCGLHIAAALERPCVILAGGREGWWWEQYDGQTYLHTIGGNLDCCKSASCWRSHVDVKYVGRQDSGRAMSEQERLGKVCLRVVDRGDGQQQPLCMDAITPGRVAAEITRFNETVPYRNPLDTKDFTRYPARRTATTEVLGGRRADVLVCLYGGALDDSVPAVRLKSHNAQQDSASLTYGMLHRRCITSLLQNTPLDLINLHVGCNSVSEMTLLWLNDVVRPEIEKHGGTFTLVSSPQNIGKYPMMGRMLKNATGEWVVWVDDDTMFTSDRWFDRAFGVLFADQACSVLGRIMRVPSVEGQWSFVESATWFQGEDPEISDEFGQPSVVYTYPSGSFFVAYRTTLEILGWPDPRLTQRNGAAMFGEACRQWHIGMKDLFADGDIGIVDNGAVRRYS